MPDPSDLLVVARLLLTAGPGRTPSDGQLRRAVSTAYYALFHKVLRTGARRFMGEEGSPGYALLYRGFNHARIKAVCVSLNAATLNANLARQLGRGAASADLRDFADAFVALQEARHRADYDPIASFLPSDVAALVEAADHAMAAFDRAAPDERADVLALMLASARG